MYVQCNKGTDHNKFWREAREFKWREQHTNRLSMSRGILSLLTR